MSNREVKEGPWWPKIVGALLVLIALSGFLGSYGLAWCKPLYGVFSLFLGNFARAGLVVCLGVGILLWVYSIYIKGKDGRSGAYAEDETDDEDEDDVDNELPSSKAGRDAASKRIPLPPGKLVDLKGFDKYFTSPEMVEVKDIDAQKAEEMKEVGEYIVSYFGAGDHRLKKPAKIVTLKGLKEYIEEVDREESVKPELPVRKVTAEKLKPARVSSIFSTPEEQKEFLAPYKDDKNQFEQDEQRYQQALKEGARVYDVLGEPSEDAEIEYPGVNWISEEREKRDRESGDGGFSGGNKRYREDEDNIDDNDNNDGLETGLAAELAFRSGSSSAAESESDLADVETPAASQRTALDDVASSSQILPWREESAVSDLRREPVPEARDGNREGFKRQEAVLWKLPGFNLLDSVLNRIIPQETESLEQLEKVLLDFGVKAKVIRVTRGPVITRYELAPAPGVKISKIVNLADDIALALAARDVRIEAPIPGKSAIGIEVPNKQARMVPFREVLETKNFREYPSKLKVALGKDIADQAVVGDLSKMPHLLVAGATGSGKSVCITSIINSILFNATPAEVKFLLVDPKMVELSQYNGIPHLLAPVVVDPKKAAGALRWVVTEMDNRYALFAAAGVRDIERYNNRQDGQGGSRSEALPFIVVIIDELADLMMVATMDVEEAIARLAQKARAAGIHLVIATQRPSVDVITGVIKANIPSRISFAVSSQIDSRTILDATGAEKLLGRGDMLYSPLGINKPLRVQGCLVTDDEVQRVITHWKGLGKPEYLDPERIFSEAATKNEESGGPDDVLFFEAGELFITTGMASVSYLQRKLKLGYTRAARLMDMLQEQGVVGNYEGSKPRQVLLTLEEFKERFAKPRVL